VVSKIVDIRPPNAWYAIYNYRKLLVLFRFAKVECVLLLRPSVELRTGLEKGGREDFQGL